MSTSAPGVTPTNQLAAAECGVDDILRQAISFMPLSPQQWGKIYAVVLAKHPDETHVLNKHFVIPNDEEGGASPSQHRSRPKARLFASDRQQQVSTRDGSSTTIPPSSAGYGIGNRPLAADPNLYYSQSQKHKARHDKSLKDPAFVAEMQKSFPGTVEIMIIRASWILGNTAAGMSSAVITALRYAVVAVPHRQITTGPSGQKE